MSPVIVPRNSRGFTLMELMIAIMIAGSIIILSVPSFNSIRLSWRLRGETQQMAAVLRAARSTAVMKNITTVFTFNPNNRTYSYFEDRDRDGARDNDEYQSATYRLVPQVRMAAYTLPGTSLSFGPMGNTKASGSITLMTSHNRFRTIWVYGGTGNVTVD